MGNSFQVEVSESQEELQHRLRHALTATTKERLQMLYWIKVSAIATRQELAQRLGRDESTVYRWLQRYKQSGITVRMCWRRRVAQPRHRSDGLFRVAAIALCARITPPLVQKLVYTPVTTAVHRG
ncbi:helix-turn-helix domain-containing protein [Nostoc sp. CHAB 5836]|uniref:helix-turn-helix domain-containing protein n=1 Tax=Nostoc sp. CHAB 5836 TaxID=2780404 RepID=UPI001E63273E|nr:helix-turn-helix domain-containing protein [Nostoc sp. CHAB 5836]MCC5619105.1 helix-turn-helix domain-containing protein [Nostoc sp. CHAB 5836]